MSEDTTLDAFLEESGAEEGTEGTDAESGAEEGTEETDAESGVEAGAGEEPADGGTDPMSADEEAREGAAAGDAGGGSADSDPASGSTDRDTPPGTQTGDDGRPGENAPSLESTMVWRPGEAACDRCGTRTERLWRENGALVCPGCKSWDAA